MRNKIFREASWLVPRPLLKGISFNETGMSGFGDRLRGISLALFLARFHRTNLIYYHETSGSQFPYRMLDLIAIEGMNFIPHSPPFPPRTLVVWHRCGYGSSLKSLGFRHLWRIRPKDQAVTDRLEQLGISEDHIGLHIRGTDAIKRKRYPDGVEAQKILLIEKLRQVRETYPGKIIFLAADSRKGIEEWSGILSKMGMQHTWNSSVSWDEEALRQSSADAMLIDFFGLSRCLKIIRLVPSEFSRFAAGIKTGKYVGYHKPDKI